MKCERDGSEKDVQKDSVTDTTRHIKVDILLCSKCRSELHSDDPGFDAWLKNPLSRSLRTSDSTTKPR